MGRETALVVAGTCLIAGTYGLVRLAYGLFLPEIQASVSMGSAVAGYLSSGASAAYCVGALAGLLGAGRPRSLVVGALGTAAAGSLGMAVAPDLRLLVPSVVVASAGAGLASPAMVGLVARNLPAARAASGQAVVNSGTGPGLVAAGVLALLLPHWRAGFVLGAGFTAAAGAAVLLLDRPRATLSGQSPGVTGPDDWWWLADLRRPSTAALLLGASSSVVWTFGRAHLVSSGTSETASVLAWVALGVGGAATVLTARVQSGQPAPRAWVFTTVVLTLAVAALAKPGAMPVAVLACGVFGWSFVAATSTLIAWTAQVGPDRAAAGTSVVFIALTAGQAAGSSAAGAVSERLGMATTFALAGGVALLAASCGWTRVRVWSLGDSNP